MHRILEQNIIFWDEVLRLWIVSWWFAIDCVRCYKIISETKSICGYVKDYRSADLKVKYFFSSFVAFQTA